MGNSIGEQPRELNCPIFINYGEVGQLFLSSPPANARQKLCFLLFYFSSSRKVDFCTLKKLHEVLFEKSYLTYGIMFENPRIKSHSTFILACFLKTWSFWSTNVTRQVNFNRTKIGGKGQKFKWDILVIFKHCAMGFSSSFSSHFSWLSKWQLFEILVLFPLWLKKFRRFLELGCFYVIHLGFKTPRVSASHWLKSFKSWQVILSLAHFVKSRIPL